MLLTIGIVAVSLLVGTKFVLDSYYVDMVEGFERAQLPKTELLDKTRADQRAALDRNGNGKIPVSIAMQTIASKGRDNADPLITAQPSDDVEPLKGWAKLPRQVHLPPQVTTITPPPMPLGDAGAPTATDAGAPTATDAGAPHVVPHLDATKDGGH
jgi:hypothetical protein